MLRPRRAGLDFGFTGEGWPLESVLRVWALGSDSEGVSRAPGNNGVRLASGVRSAAQEPREPRAAAADPGLAGWPAAQKPPATSLGSRLCPPAGVSTTP